MKAMATDKPVTMGTKEPHFLHAANCVVLEAQSTGPFAITYVDLKDDPRTGSTPAFFQLSLSELQVSGPRPQGTVLPDTTTGERAVYRSEHERDDPDHPGEFAAFVWREGNFACDCNQEQFFLRALGRPEPPIDAVACTRGRYRVERIVRLSDGKVVYIEPHVRGLGEPFFSAAAGGTGRFALPSGCTPGS